MKHTRESIIAFINDCRKNGKRIDLSGQDLSGLDLQEANLQRTNLRRTNLQEANLQDANLREANLREADLRGADLRGADLREADLQGADLREANLDYCGIELSCQTIGVKVGRRLVSQLLYHMCRMDVQDCPEWDELRNDERVIALANQSHVISKHALATIER